MSNPIIELNNLSVIKNNNLILENITLSLKKGDFFAILGSNGSGKSTLIKAILGIYKYQGKCYIDSSQKISYVPQSYRNSLTINYSGVDLIKSGLLSNKKYFFKSADRQKVNQAIKEVNADSFAKKTFAYLSGGQKQKIVIARGLVSNPDIIILDEPMTGVDTNSEKEFIKLLSQLKKLNKTIIIILHDFEPFCELINKVIVLNNGKITYKTNKITKELNKKIFDSKHRHKHDIFI